MVEDLPGTAIVALDGVRTVDTLGRMNVRTYKFCFTKPTNVSILIPASKTPLLCYLFVPVVRLTCLIGHEMVEQEDLIQTKRRLESRRRKTQVTRQEPRCSRAEPVQVGGFVVLDHMLLLHM